jgi:hypothetical protein
MTPLFAQVQDDPEYTPQRYAVYGALVRLLDPDEPREVKERVVERLAGVHSNTVRDAIRWLIRRGYVTLHGRGYRGVAVLTLARSVTHSARPA